MRPNGFLRLIIILLSFALFTSGCEEEESGTTSGGSNGFPDFSVDEGTVDGSGFWVNVPEGEFPTFMSSLGNFNDGCFVPTTATSSQDLVCILDINEGDLYNRAFSLQYNVAPGMCEHITVFPPWHWNQSFGFGPNRIEIEVDDSGNIADLDGDLDGGCEAFNENLGTMQACTLHPEISNVASTGATCAYDDRGAGRANCCFGLYDLNVSTDSDGDGTADTFANTNGVNWGGDVGSCLGGTVQTDWSETSTEGYPVGSIQAVPKNSTGDLEGWNSSVTLSSNASSIVTNYSHHANYFQSVLTGATDIHSHNGFFSGTTVTLPYPIYPVDDLDGSAIPGSVGNVLLANGQPAWRFQCEDEGFEIIHRINLYIREWNIFSDFTAYEQSSGVVVQPDSTACTGLPDPAGCNDQTDMDDAILGLGTYDTSTPNATLRSSWFPNVDY